MDTFQIMTMYPFVEILKSKTINSINRYGVDGDYLESELSNLFDKDKIRAELYKSYCQFAKGKKVLFMPLTDNMQLTSVICMQLTVFQYA